MTTDLKDKRSVREPPEATPSRATFLGVLSCRSQMILIGAFSTLRTLEDDNPTGSRGLVMRTYLNHPATLPQNAIPVIS